MTPSDKSISKRQWPFVSFYMFISTIYLWLKGLFFVDEDQIIRDEAIVSHENTNNVEEKTPEEIFNLKISQKLFVDALEIAEQYKFDTDDVFKAQWLNGVLNEESILKYLRNVHDLTWVINECCNKVGNSLGACQCLLNYGIQCIERMQNPQPFGKPFDMSNNKIEELKFKLMNQLRRLGDYETCLISGDDHFSADDYAKIRSYSSFDLAIHLAQTNSFVALKNLLLRRKQELYKYWLIILDHICETIEVQTYEFLLPRKMRCTDFWCSEVSISQKMDNDIGFEDPSTASLSEEQSAFILNDAGFNTDTDLFSKWYKYRSIKIEYLTAMPDLTENMLKRVVLDFGFEELSTLLDDFKFLRIYTYTCAQGNYEGYKKFVNLTPADVANKFLTNTPHDDVERLISDFILPYFVHCHRKQTSDQPPFRLLYNITISQSTESLTFLLSFLRCLNQNKNGNDINYYALLDESFPDHILTLINDCFSQCEDDKADFIETGLQIINLCTVEGLCKVQISESKILSILHKHLRAMEQLRHSYAIHYTYKDFKRLCANEKESMLLLKRLSRKAVTDALDRAADKTRLASAMLAKSQIYQLNFWRTILHSIDVLRDQALETLKSEHCIINLVEAMLCSSDERLIKLAAEFLDSSDSKNEVLADKLSSDTTKSLLLSCGLSYVNESVNSRDKALQYAKQCFNLLKIKPLPDEIRIELDFVEALPILDSLGVSDLPVRLRLYVDKSVLIDRIFELNSNLYQDCQTVEKLCILLRVPDANEKRSRCYALRRCAERALECGDQLTCSSYCNRLEQLSDASSWRVCRALARDPACEVALMHRRRLLIFCAGFCDVDELTMTLNDFKALEDSLNSDQRLRKSQRLNDFAARLTHDWIADEEDENDRLIEATSSHELQQDSLKTVLDKAACTTNTDDSAEFNEVLKKAKSLLEDGQLQEAGCLLMKAYRVPPGMRTYNAALCMIERLKSSL